MERGLQRSRKDRIGKFGYGLKDAIAVLYPHGIKMKIRSSQITAYFDFRLKSLLPVSRKCFNFSRWSIG